MSKIILTKKINAIFLTIVLVAGVFAMSSPLTVYGQQYEQDYLHNYQQYYDFSYYYSSDPRMHDNHSAKSSQKANCDNENVNVNDLSQVQRQEQAIGNNVDNAVDEATLDGQQLTPEEEALNAITGNGDGGSQSLLNIDRNIVNICINSNDNTLSGTFTSTQTQTVDECAEDVEACFAENLNDSVEFALLTTALENGLDVVIEGEPITLNNFADICSALEGLTFDQLHQAIIEIIVKAGINSLSFNLLTCIAQALDIPRP